MPAATTELFRSQSAMVVADLADELGCRIEDFTSEALVVVSRPADADERFLARIATAGLGTVASVVPELVEWADEHAPSERHFRAMQPFFLAELAEEARRRHWPSARAYGFHLGFALAEELRVPALPAALSLTAIDAEWMTRYRDSKVFDNAMGEPGEPHVPSILHGFAVVDRTGEPLAVAGVWRQGTRRDEIGVDVRRDARGTGLARIVVIRATQDILGRGRAPYYSIGATNVRSHRNALSCGFLPVYMRGIVAVE